MLYKKSDYTCVDVSDIDITGNILPQQELKGKTKNPLLAEDIAFIQEFATKILGAQGWTTVDREIGSLRAETLASVISRHTMTGIRSSVRQNGHFINPSTTINTNLVKLVGLDKEREAFLATLNNSSLTMHSAKYAANMPKSLDVDYIRSLYGDINQLYRFWVNRPDSQIVSGSWEDKNLDEGTIEDSGTFTNEQQSFYYTASYSRSSLPGTLFPNQERKFDLSSYTATYGNPPVDGVTVVPYCVFLIWRIDIYTGDTHKTEYVGQIETASSSSYNNRVRLNTSKLTSAYCKRVMKFAGYDPDGELPSGMFTWKCTLEGCYEAVMSYGFSTNIGPEVRSLGWTY